MINTFESPRPASYLFVLLIAAILATGHYIHTDSEIIEGGPLSNWWNNLTNTLLFGVEGLHLFVKSLMLIFLAFYFNRICGTVELFQRYTLLPGVVFLIQAFALTIFIDIHAILPGLFFILASLSQLIRVREAEERFAQNVFYAAFFVAIASLFYQGFAFFLIWVWFLMPSIGAFTVRHFLLSVVGFVLPFLFGVTAFVAIGKFEVFAVEIVSLIPAKINPGNDFTNMPAEFIFFILLSFFGYLRFLGTGRQLLAEVKSGFLIFSAVFFPALLQLIITDVQFNIKIPVFLPLMAVYTTYLFTENGDKVLYKLLFYFMLIFSVLLPWFYIYQQQLIRLLEELHIL